MGVQLVVGLAGFLLVATAGVPASHENVDRGPAIAAGLVTVGAAVACVLVARERQGATAAALLGVATGIAHAGTATLTKAATNLLAHGPATLVTSWQLYALVAAGAVGLLLNQLSFQAGRAAGLFTGEHEAFWAAAHTQLGDAGGTRALVEVLLLHRNLERADVLTDIRPALSVESTSADVVALEGP